MTGIDLGLEEQLTLARELQPFFADVPVGPDPAWRYRPSGVFPSADAAVYYALLRATSPAHVIEVGAGYTSALALDTRDRHLPDLRLTFIDPYSERLDTLLRETDRDSCTVIRKPVQDVPLTLFDQLEPGDVLFCDTDHFTKTGSEVNWLIFNVWPRLKPGVLVHVHDMFWPFEYPVGWLEDRRGYNELYLVRALLMFSDAFGVKLFDHWLWANHPEYFAGIKGNSTPPGSLWLVRRESKWPAT